MKKQILTAVLIITIISFVVILIGILTGTIKDTPPCPGQ